MIVEKLHPDALLGLHHRGNLEGLPLADVVLDGRVPDHDLEGGDPSLAVCSGQKDLGDHGLQRHGKLGADLLLLLAGKLVNDAVNGSGGPRGVQGAEDEVTGLGSGDGGCRGFQVANFTEHDDIRVLAKNPAQGFGEGGHVLSHFPLVHHRLL